MSVETHAYFGPELVTVQELSEYLKVPISWIYQKTRKRSGSRLPHYKLGKYLRFDLREVQEWLKGQSRH